MMNRTKLTHALWARITAFFLLVLFTLASIGCAALVLLAVENDWYLRKPDFYESWIYNEMLDDDLYDTEQYYFYGEPSFFEEYMATCQEGNYLFRILDSNGTILKDTVSDASATRMYAQRVYIPSGLELSEVGETESGELVIEAYLRTPLQPGDGYYAMEQFFVFLYRARYTVLIVGALLTLASFVLFVFLMCSAGHKPGEEQCVLLRQDKIPFDLYLVLAIMLGALWGSFASDALYSSMAFVRAAVIGVSIVFYSILVYLFCMTLAARLKVGKWWRNTIIYRFFRMIFRLIRGIVRSFPLTWRVALGYCVFMLINIICILVLPSNGSFLGFLFFLTLDSGMLAFLCIVTIQMKMLQKAGKALADGNLDHKVNTENLYFDFKEHGENLNRIKDGITKAVDERMKSERFKTELITNVSHDIKTPLTSIINYIDLLKKEHLEGEKAAAYLEVLERQAGKLKKLTEDIIEASKASAGVIAVNLERTDAVELLNQSLGEYGERLEKSGISAVVGAPESGAWIHADGRLLWRVFDNILQNICKYALPGTRAYFDIIPQKDRIEITAKNISASALNISAEALMERFIRGDSSRSGEGSGLGISIAKSLTELQGGTFAIQLDGDLFKVVLSFPMFTETEKSFEPES